MKCDGLMEEQSVLNSEMSSNPGPTCSKLMRLGSPNRIVDDLDSKAVDLDRRITSIRISTIKIESTIGNSIENRSIFYLFLIKSIIFDLFID